MAFTLVTGFCLEHLCLIPPITYKPSPLVFRITMHKLQCCRHPLFPTSPLLILSHNGCSPCVLNLSFDDCRAMNIPIKLLDALDLHKAAHRKEPLLIQLSTDQVRPSLVSLLPPPPPPCYPLHLPSHKCMTCNDCKHGVTALQMLAQ